MSNKNTALADVTWDSILSDRIISVTLVQDPKNVTKFNNHKWYVSLPKFPEHVKAKGDNYNKFTQLNKTAAALYTQEVYDWETLHGLDHSCWLGKNTTDDIYDDTPSQLTIECPATGPKPDITIEFSLLQNQNCYGITIRIKNLHTKYDIRSWSKAIIVAGYRRPNMAPAELQSPGSAKGEFTMTMSCPIFSSYIESPSPDSVTVFSGVIMDSFDSFFTDRQIIITVYEAPTVRDFIFACVDKAGGGAKDTTTDTVGSLAVRIEAPDEFLNTTIESLDKTTYTCAGGYALIMWMTGILQSVGQSAGVTDAQGVKHAVVVGVELYGNTVHIIVPGFLPPDTTTTSAIYKNAVVLNHIKSASFTGPALNVIAPWVPNLIPGDYFKMAPNIFNGSALPNSIDKSLYINKENLYHIITMSGKFSTCDNTNEMNILAIPAQSELNSLDEALSTNGTAAEWQKNYENLSRRLEFGRKTEVSIGTAGTASSTGKWYSETFGSNIVTGAVDHTVAAHQTLSSIAELYWGDKISYTKTNKDLGNRKLPFAPAIGMPNPTFTGTDFWPLIAASTYYKMSQKTDINYHVDTEHPDGVQIGWILSIPSLSNPDDYASSKEIFKDMAKVYLAANNGYGKIFANIYVYLGGTWS